MFGMKLTKLSKTFHVKLTQNVKLLTKVRLLLEPYLFRVKCLHIYFPTSKYSYGLTDHLIHLFFSISFAIFHHGSQYLATTVAAKRNRTPRLTKIVAAIFYFSENVGYPILPIS